jgi:hypothetical protein
VRHVSEAIAFDSLHNRNSAIRFMWPASDSSNSSVVWRKWNAPPGPVARTSRLGTGRMDCFDQPMFEIISCHRTILRSTGTSFETNIIPITQASIPLIGRKLSICCGLIPALPNFSILSPAAFILELAKSMRLRSTSVVIWTESLLTQDQDKRDDKV